MRGARAPDHRARPDGHRGDRRLLGGVLTETINWHWIFFVNVPIGVATALLAIRLVPDREGLGLDAVRDRALAVIDAGVEADEREGHVCSRNRALARLRGKLTGPR